MRTPHFLFTAASMVALFLSSALWAEAPGQADLDQATELQLTAETLGDLEKVIALGEEAIKKGVEKDQETFAKQLVSSALYSLASRRCEAIFGQQPPNPRWQLVRERALKELDRALTHDPQLPDAHLLKARLLRLPGGDNEAAKKSIDEAIKQFKVKDASKQLALSFILRAQMVEDMAEKLADIDRAIEADPEAADALRLRVAIRLEQGKHAEAVADLLKLLEKDSNNPALEALLAESLTNLKKYDEALQHINKVIEENPEATIAYNLRARIYILKDDLKEAEEDLNKVLKIDSDDVGALLLRSRVYAAQEKQDAAEADVERALKLKPDLPQAILMRSLLAAEQKRYGQAIADLQILLRADPKNAEYRLQMAAYYAADSRPRKAIEMLDRIVEEEPKNADALRARGDALLSVGKHAEAIKDYNVALEVEPEDTGVLNNLAWVLSTSPQDPVRNGKRAIELATKACELTKYKKPHILSTLASAYAEAGDFDKAVEWSGKAVELGGDELKEQLKKELDSYKEKKPFRESQNIEENTKPLDPKQKNDDLET